MKLFGFNKDSILNNSTARIINNVVIGIVVLVGISNESEIKFNLLSLFLLILISSIISVYSTYKVVESIDFYEWDYTERRKKYRFCFTYLFICIILSSLFTLSCYIWYLFVSYDISFVGKVLGVLPSIIFGFNILNIVSLFYPLFEDDLTLAYKIQKKPDNWQDKGKDIKNECEIEEIVCRDFRI